MLVAPGGRASQLAGQRVFKSLCGMLQASTGGKSCLIRGEAHTLLPTHLINNVQYASEDACTRAGDRSGAEGTVGPETGLCGPRGRGPVWDRRGRRAEDWCGSEGAVGPGTRKSRLSGGP